MKHILFVGIVLLVVLVASSLIRQNPHQEIDEGYTTSDDYENAFVTSSLSLPPPSTSETAQITMLPDNPESYSEIFHGVFMQSRGGIIIIRARLNDPDVQFFVGHPSSTTLVCRQLEQFGLQIAVNGSGFYADSGIVDPFGMVDGEIYSTIHEPGITVAIDEDNQVTFVQDAGHLPENTRYAITAFNRIVQRGEILDRFYPDDPNYKAGYGTVRPRTVLSTDGEYLTIILFETPRTVTAAGEYVLENFPGTTDVFNMDGGGSTNGCAQGLGPLVTETGRPVANVFGIFAPPTH